jgi:outer membrane protein assembly factor BamD
VSASITPVTVPPAAQSIAPLLVSAGRGAYLAAANRAQMVVKDYSQTPVVEDALYIMVRSYDALGMTELRDDAKRVLNTNFPNSQLLANGGRRKEKGPWWKLW